MCCPKPRTLHQGLSLIELLVVLVITSLLASLALSRYTALSDAAHRAGVKATGAAFASAVVLVHVQWRVNGGGGAAVDVPGFGAGNVDVSADGWPVDTGDATSADVTPARCLQLWRALLYGNAPEVALAAGAGVDYVVSAPAPHRCRYVSQQLGSGRQIEYDAASGTVVTIAPPASNTGGLPWRLRFGSPPENQREPN